MKLMRNDCATHVDFGFLSGAIETNKALVPSNLDMICERKGRFFVGEWKRDGEKVSAGQQILLKALAANPYFAVFIVYGDTDDSVRIGKYYQVINGKCILKGEGLIAFKETYQEWYEYADKDRTK